MKPLNETEISSMLKRIPSWKRAGDSIERTWRFKSFVEAVAFMDSVFILAEKANHHPNLTNVWTKVTIRYTSHDSGGLTRKDFEMAEKIDKIA